jgi:hypothetical protein
MCTRTIRKVHRRYVTALVGVFLFVGCGGGTEAAQPAPEAHTSASTATTAPAAPEHLVAESRTPLLDVFAGPSGVSDRMTLDVADQTSGRLVFLVKEDRGGDRIEVHLPVRPNGTTGWVRRDEVDLSSHGFSVEVSLGAHRLVVRNGDEVVFDAPIGVGTEDTPTPGGVFYIKELLAPPSPNGPYGPYAYGLSGYSNVLDDFAGGDGVIGIHGTDDPSTIGRDVSHGCIRLRNSDIERLVHDVGLPLGTPVEIKA